MSSTENLQSGRVLANRYRISHILGRGGMGAVYQAHDQSLADKPVAIKEMRLSALDDKSRQQALAQFRQEAQFLANLDHPNLVQVSDFFSEDGQHYLVMALVKGQSLGDMLSARKGAFPVARVLEWGRQLATVLTYLHNQNPPILFRDLKPSNIMLDGSGTIRLIDFGIARSFQAEGATATFLQGVGSAGYSPLEQYQGAGGTDPRSDIYALGATLFHLLTNRVPPGPVDLVAENKPMPSPRRWNPTLPPALDQILLKMLAIRKEERYQKMEQVLGLLDQVAANLEQSHDPATLALGGSPSLPPPDSSNLANAPTLGISVPARATSVSWMAPVAVALMGLALVGWWGTPAATPAAAPSPRQTLSPDLPSPPGSQAGQPMPVLPEQARDSSHGSRGENPDSAMVVSGQKSSPTEALPGQQPPRIPPQAHASPAPQPPDTERLPSLGDGPRVPQALRRTIPEQPALHPDAGTPASPPPPSHPELAYPPQDPMQPYPGHLPPPGGEQPHPPFPGGPLPGGPFPPGPEPGTRPEGPPIGFPGQGPPPPPRPSSKIPGYD